MKKIIVFFLLFLFTSNAFAASPDPNDIVLPEGYKAEVFAQNLSLPTTAIFDGDDLLVAESGFGNVAKARVIRISKDGTVDVVAQEGLLPPVTGLLKIGDKLFISHRTKVSVLENGKLTDIVTGLPSDGDHQNNKIVLGPDGKIYLGQGTVTNTAVVGTDNYLFGWLDKNPSLHDVPCRDITLSGKNFTSDNPLTKNSNDSTTTGAYVSFGQSTTKGQIIKGQAKCNGAILRFNQDGSNLEMYAWGMRNPFGLQFDKAGQLWTTFHGADVRGSRNVYNDTDYLVKVTKDAWYGWPDYFNGKPATSSQFTVGHENPGMLLLNHPTLFLPFAYLPSHGASNGLAFSPELFGQGNSAMIAMFGTFAPVTTGTNLSLPGFGVMRVDLNTKEETMFAKNKLPGPSYLNQTGGFNRPSDVLFGKDNSMYVVDWGSSDLTKKGLEEVPATGVIWRIYKTEGQVALRSNGPIVIPANINPEGVREPLVRNTPDLYKKVIADFWIPLLLIALVVIFIIYRVRRRAY